VTAAPVATLSSAPQNAGEDTGAAAEFATVLRNARIDTGL